MKVIALALFVILITPSIPGFAEEISHMEGIKTGAETLVNGTALLGMSDETSIFWNAPSSESRQPDIPRNWRDLVAMQRARQTEADFGK
jgi:hypothetical protein